MYDEILKELSIIGSDDVLKIVFSDSKSEVPKAVIRPVLLKNKKAWQCEKIKNNSAFHENFSEDGLAAYAAAILDEYRFRQINIFATQKNLSFRISKKQKVSRSESFANIKAASEDRIQSHDRAKKYILTEGTPVSALIDLGVFDENYRIIKSKYDKYKQINRFVELIDDEFRDYKGGGLTIVDYGCGKSYLSFVIYYYFTHIKNINVKIIGFDIKSEIVDDCNKIAVKYGYDNLKFVTGDITRQKLADINPDMLITLHLCDTATDHALYFALQGKIRYIFSVPCCQHELNRQIKNSGDFSLILRHGLYKERFAAILTDCIRCEALESFGYDVDVIEFVDFSNTPKNALIRARLSNRHKSGIIDKRAVSLLERFGASHTLVDLLKSDYGNDY